MTSQDYLRSLLLEPGYARDFTVRRGPNGLSPTRGWTYDSELGWVHADAVHEGDGVNCTRTFYHYEADGARRVLNAADKPCRIHTYGDSFTHCDQVNDGETWQEYLAAHLQEPVRNFGVGGYGVYQAYRRMKKVDAQLAATGQPRATHVILNVYDDDHFRNLDAWRRIRVGPLTSCGVTLPHLRVDADRGVCVEHENLIQSPDYLRKLCDERFVQSAFQDDATLRTMLAMSRREVARRPDDFEVVATCFGLPPHLYPADDAARQVWQKHQRASLVATRCVLEMTERFCDQTGKTMMVMLSFGAQNIAFALEGRPRFDQDLLDFLKTRRYPVLDMRDAFAAAWRDSKLSPADFLKPYYNGHHSPAGNFFTAWAMVPRVVAWLKPAPAPYSAAAR